MAFARRTRGVDADRCDDAWAGVVRPQHRELAAALYLASCDVDLDDALELAAQAKDPDRICALNGALIGASTGVTPWMEEQFAQHEFAWQIEVLVRDLFVVGLTSDEPVEEIRAWYPKW
ncbi:hypothetical protein GCM10011492_05760 [Flexivirga endophytica]|uniref:Uncharacterized protein n=1 Tax=Flexivirga endophytica TaxID=1849103 RepID=A0A916SUV7_9MICO|nr:hypothetical protein [Flexivirga endophytica]GGB18751.1 hypothetical protein GCM10011492_05760 [Flexivirga endophytica]GHB36924.1 hypothetical protein GCM10008112_01850 [Flexivirga endophytica]